MNILHLRTRLINNTNIMDRLDSLDIQGEMM
jgi:hypothetical protein